MNRLDDDPLRDAFVSYRNDTIVRTRGLGEIAAAVKRRRRVRLARVLTSATVLIVIPALVYALLAPGDKSDLPIGPVQTPTPVGSDEAIPFPEAQRSPEEIPTTTVPAGGLSADALGDATVDIPAWNATSYPGVSCESGRKTFRNGQAPQGNGQAALRLRLMGYADVDRDRRHETIAKLTCPQEEIGPEQLVAISSGSQTVGQVITTSNGVRQIEEVIGKSDGTLHVLVNDNALCCDRHYTSAQHQWRSFRWNGQAFSQTYGTAEFHGAASDSDIKVSLGELPFGKPVNGIRTGSLQVTIQNTGTANVRGVLLVFNLRHVQAPQWASSGPRGLPSVVRWELNLAPGINESMSFPFETRESDPKLLSVGVIAIPQVSRGYEGHFSDLLRDKNPADNEGPGQLTGLQPQIRLAD